MPRERTARPLCVIDTLVEVPRGRTNRSRLDAFNFTVHAYVETTLEDCGAFVKRILAALEDAPLVIAGADLLLQRRGKVRYLEEDYGWHAVTDVEARVRQDATSNPP